MRKKIRKTQLDIFRVRVAIRLQISANSTQRYPRSQNPALYRWRIGIGAAKMRKSQNIQNKIIALGSLTMLLIFTHPN
ncbi:MAG: hypothetical protein ACYTDW_13950, partial [Planctomycetota bacterium]